ncbi:hypothetical protein SmJEL517_g01672 [Synchytrium microbalum]|uniref:Protein kinase domain-containing protein n=1 Tax=Synchytrium microbalum TaxID=1806994 RepID=A0A507C9N6_9FUNG|nr:uncharacterized protein SmJEL517_g01672 [Synchytrium microbalum]TPX35879.1 hypothetical protein SmJEL517_g01672 [Synchytrium microbalum]
MTAGIISSGLYDWLFGPNSIEVPQGPVVISGCDTGFGNSLSYEFAKRRWKVYSGCLTAAAVKEFEASALGIGYGGSVEWTPMEAYRKVMDVNFMGMVEMTKAFPPSLRLHVKKRPDTLAPRIINITSVAGRITSAFSDALRIELAPFGVRVVIIEPFFAINHEDFNTLLDGIKSSLLYVYMDAECNTPLEADTSLNAITTSAKSPLRVVRPAPPVSRMSFTMERPAFSLSGLRQSVLIRYTGPIETDSIISFLKSSPTEFIPIREWFRDPADLEQLNYVKVDKSAPEPWLHIWSNFVRQLDMPDNGSESLYHFFWDCILLRPLLYFCELSELVVEYNRDTADASSATLRLKRPDVCVWLNGRLVYKSEEKKTGVGLGDPSDELVEKDTNWWIVTYGQLPMYLCTATNGKLVQTKALKVVIPLLNLQAPSSRIRAAVFMMNYSRVLQAYKQDQGPGLPLSIFKPDVKVLSKEMGIIRTLILYDDKIEKKIENFDGYIYSDLEISFTAVKCLGATKLFECILEGLRSLHRAALVHRDLRWENVIRTHGMTWVIIDLENGGRADTNPLFALGHWNDQAVGNVKDERGKYCPKHDIQSVGPMIDKLRQYIPTAYASLITVKSISY